MSRISTPHFLLFALLGGLVAPLESQADDGSLTVLRGGRVVSPDGRGGVTILPNGVVYLKDGRIERVGDKLPDPEGATVVDLAGAWLLPGFIDAHYLVGDHLAETNEISSAITAEFTPTTAFDPWDDELARLHPLGVTSLAVSPGNQNVVGGRIELVRVCPGQYPLERIEAPAAYKAAVGIEVLNAGQSKRLPTSISGAMRLLRSWVGETFPVADATKENLTALEPPSRAAAARVLVHVESRNQAARLVGAFAGRPVEPLLLHGWYIEPEAWRRLEGYDHLVVGPYLLTDPIEELRVPAELARRDKVFALASDGERQDLLTSAVLAMRHGLSFADALAALTSSPARIFGVEDRVGRIASGLDADLVAWSDNPFSLRGRVEGVWCRGKKVYTAPPKPEAAPGFHLEVGGQAMIRTLSMRATLLLGAWLLLLSAIGAETLVVRAPRVFTGSGPALDDGVIIVEDGKITKVGPASEVKIPDGVRVLGTRGTVTPGWIDAGTVAGVRGRPAEEFEEVTPAVQVLDAIDLDDDAYEKALAAGVTALAVGPGDRNVIGGLGAVLRTAPGTLEESVLDERAFQTISFTTAAYANNRSLRSGSPYTIYFRIPTTRMGTIFLARRAFAEATGQPAPELEAEVGRLTRFLSEEAREELLRATRGERRVRIAADYKQEILAAIRLGREFGFTPVIEGAAEAARLVDEIREAKAELLVRPGAHVGRVIPRTRPDRFLDLPRTLAEAKIPFAFYTGASAGSSDLRTALRLDVRFGLSEQRAIEAVTSSAARILGLGDRLGTIAPGRRADLVIFSGSPFSMLTRVEWVVSGTHVARGSR